MQPDGGCSCKMADAGAVCLNAVAVVVIQNLQIVPAAFTKKKKSRSRPTNHQHRSLDPRRPAQDAMTSLWKSRRSTEDVHPSAASREPSPSKKSLSDSIGFSSPVDSSPKPTAPPPRKRRGSRAALSTINSVGYELEHEAEVLLSQTDGAASRPPKEPLPTTRPSPPRAPASQSSARDSQSTRSKVHLTRTPSSLLKRVQSADQHKPKPAPPAPESRPANAPREHSKRNMFRYFFGGKAEEPAVAAEDHARKDSLTPEQDLENKLQQLQKKLDETNAALSSRDAEVSTLQNRAEELAADYKIKEAALLQQKNALEEHMVSVVVQQITDARKAERDSVQDGLEKEYNAKLDAIQHEHEAKITALIRDHDATKYSSESLKTELDAQIEKLKADIEEVSAKHTASESRRSEIDWRARLRLSKTRLLRSLLRSRPPLRQRASWSKRFLSSTPLLRSTLPASRSSTARLLPSRLRLNLTSRPRANWNRRSRS
ncbi:hypothetical protein HDK64DRAFT_138176 [Phyllosticta capitalensis]